MLHKTIRPVAISSGPRLMINKKKTNWKSDNTANTPVAVGDRPVGEAESFISFRVVSDKHKGGGGGEGEGGGGGGF